MTNKKLLQIVAVFAVAAVLFCTILIVGMQKIRREQAATTAPTLPTSAPTTLAPTETVPAVTIDGNRIEGDAGGTTAPTTQSALTPTQQTEPTTAAGFTVPQGKNAIIQTYVNAVNKLKSTPDFKLERMDTLNVQIDEMNPSSMRSLANKIIAGNTKTAPDVYTFSGGSDAASGKSATYVIAPAGKNASLDPTIVTSATATATADGGCTISLVLGADTQTLQSPPAKLSGAMDVLSVEAMGLPSSAKINDMTVNYNNSTITATLDSQGRITSMQHRLVVTDSTANGTYVMSVNVRMHGDASAQYKVTY